jgi:hypothetical protein
MRVGTRLLLLLLTIIVATRQQAQTTEIGAFKTFCPPNVSTSQCAFPTLTLRPGSSVSMLLGASVFDLNPADDVIVTDVLPPTLTFAGIGFEAPCTTPEIGQSGTIQCFFGTVSNPVATTNCPACAAIPQAVRIELKISPSAIPGSRIVNTAIATTSTPENGTVSNSTSKAISILPSVPILSDWSLAAVAAALCAVALMRLR